MALQTSQGPRRASDVLAGGIEPRVDVVIGGVQKGGTTALDQVLRSHPAVRMPTVKEPHWFDDDPRFERGMPDFAPYHALFGDELVTRLCCDATPSYLWWPGAAQRIRDYNAAMRWIVLLRDPATRAYSHWNMQRSRGNEPLDFREAVRIEEERLRDAPPRDARRHSYVTRGFYARQLERLFGLFPRDAVLVLRSDRLRNDFAESVGRVYDFLGLEPIDGLEPVSAHEGTYDETLPDADRAALVRVFEPDVRALERLLGWDLADWLR